MPRWRRFGRTSSTRRRPSTCASRTARRRRTSGAICSSTTMSGQSGSTPQSSRWAKTTPSFRSGLRA
ncbi:unnamed protein product [Ectocarpus sp. 4 AP-2014]